MAATRLLETVLFEVQPVDAQVYLGVTFLLALVALVASYFPARAGGSAGMRRRRCSRRQSEHSGWRRRTQLEAGRRWRFGHSRRRRCSARR